MGTGLGGTKVRMVVMRVRAMALDADMGDFEQAGVFGTE